MSYHQRRAGLSPSVTVAVRVRPLLAHEEAEAGRESIVEMHGRRTMVSPPNGAPPQLFTWTTRSPASRARPATGRVRGPRIGHAGPGGRRTRRDSAGVRADRQREDVTVHDVRDAGGAGADPTDLPAADVDAQCQQLTVSREDELCVSKVRDLLWERAGGAPESVRPTLPVCDRRCAVGAHGDQRRAAGAAAGGLV
eukprot:806783-Rhodomonas_salina.1